MKTKNIMTLITKTASFMLSVCLMLGAAKLYADMGLPEAQPYNFGPEGRNIQDLRDFGKPSEMTNILTHRPVAAREKDGSRVYFSPDGNMTVQVSANGNMTFSMKGHSKTVNANGELVQETQNIKGTDRVAIKNGNGQITGYNQLGYGGKVVSEYDGKGNLTKTRVYDTYGKTIQVVLDELSLTKTVFDNNGNPKYDQNFEGAIVARYNYDAEQRLVSKVDNYGNVTHFDEQGNMTYSEDHRGQKMAQYYYKTDDEGRYILEKIEDLSPGESFGEVTYFENGRQQYSKSRFGGVTREYHYDGNSLVYTFDTRTNETTWYDSNGKATCSTFNDTVVKEWLYYKSRLVGYYDHNQGSVVLYQNERQANAVKVYAQQNVPTAEEIEKYFESQGLMSDIAVSQLAVNSESKQLQRKLNIFDASPRMLSEHLPSSIFSIVQSVLSDVQSAKNSVQASKMNYSAQTGKLESVVSKNLDDATGWVTELVVDQTRIVVSGDQGKNQALAAKLLDAINKGANLGDIAAGTGELASFARTIKTITFGEGEFSGMSDQQICNITGWNMNAANTSTLINDARARSVNAGGNGVVQVSFGYSGNVAGNRLFSVEIAASDSNGYAVGGLNGQSRLLALSSLIDYSAVLVSGGEKTDLAVSLTNNNTPAGNNKYSSNDKVQTVNGVTRTYSENGVILSEVDSVTGVRKEFDKLGRITSVFRADGVLDQSFTYGANGALQSAVSLYTDQSGKTDYVTTFYVGWGAAQYDQPAITVMGDQTGNAALAAALWNRLSSGSSISDISSGSQDSELSSFARTVQGITINPSVVMHMSDQQLGNLFGLGVSGLTTGLNYQTVRNIAADTGADGAFSIQYDSNHTAYQIGIYHGSKMVAALSLSALGMEYNLAQNTLEQSTGLSSLLNAVGAISSAINY